MMMSLLAMSVGVAGADITRPPCSTQLRADDMCHAAALPGSQAETVKKPGVCLVCLVPGGDDAADPARAETRLYAASGTVAPGDARRTGPWRPPRVPAS